MNDFIPYGRQTITPEDVEAVVSVLNSRNLTQGPAIADFERALAEICGARFAVAVNSGTSALHIAALASGLVPGQKLLTSPISFAASSNCALYCGADVGFVDIETETFNMSPVDLAKRIDQSVRAVVPVHMTGNSCDMRKISAVVKDAEKKYGHRIFIIEDAAHALGASYNGKPVGACEFSDMAVFSFHPVKSITTGEGGAVLTNDPELYNRLMCLRTHGIQRDSNRQKGYITGPWVYEMQYLGYNYRITDIQAALGLSQLKRLDSFIKRRREIATTYHSKLNQKALTLPTGLDLAKSAWHLYVVRFDFSGLGKSREEVMGALRELGVGSQVHYIPIYKHPFYKENFSFSETDFPCAEKFYESCLSIPIFPSMTDADVETVVKVVSQISGSSK